jgi:hypothetical protein
MARWQLVRRLSTASQTLFGCHAQATRLLVASREASVVEPRDPRVPERTRARRRLDALHAVVTTAVREHVVHRDRLVAVTA